MPKVSVIIPCYNAADTIGAAIDSVLAQTLQDFEIIVVDDGSTDDMQAVLTRYSDQVTFIQQANRGPGAARNAGMHIASGEYLVFLDADDTLLPIKLELQTAYLDENPDVDVVYSDGNLVTISSNGQENQVLFSRVGLLNTSLGTPNQNIPILLKRNAFLIHTALVRRTACEQVGGFDENMTAMEDWDFWYRIGWLCNFAYQHTPTVIYKSTAVGLTHDKAKMLRNSLYMEHKIEQSSDFQRLSGKLQSSYYFGLGLSALKLGDSHLARQRFRKAINQNPKDLVALLAWMFIIVLPGSVAVNIFLYLHRRLNVRGRLGL